MLFNSFVSYRQCKGTTIFVLLQAILGAQSPYGALWILNATYGNLFEQNIWIIQEKAVSLQYETNS